MYNKPIVANYIREDDAIGGHDVTIVRKNGSPKMVNVTQPVGVVPESAQWWWETVEQEDGAEHEYLCTQVLLWKRQEAYEKIKQDGIIAESMEIHINAAQTVDGVYTITDFEFLAFCLLGNCQPCFESASLALFSKDQFKAEMSQMLAEASRIAEYKLEGANVKLNEKLKLMQKFGLNLDNIDFELDKYSLEELQVKFEEITGKRIDDEDDKVDTVDPGPVPANEDNTEEPEGETAEMSLLKYSMTAEQFRRELKRALHTKRCEGCGGNRYWLVDYDTEAQVAICEDCEQDWLWVAIPYAVNGDIITADFTKAYRVKAVFQPLETAEEGVSEVANQIEEYIKAAVAEVEQKYAPVVAERDELKKYKDGVEEEKRVEAEEEVFNKFSDLNGNESFEALKKNTAKFSIEELEEKCFAIKGRTATFSHKPSAQKSVVLPVAGMHDDNSNEPYGGIVKKFTKK